MTLDLFFEKWGPNKEYDWESFSRDLGQLMKAAQAEQRRKDADIARSWVGIDLREYETFPTRCGEVVFESIRQTKNRIADAIAQEKK